MWVQAQHELGLHTDMPPSAVAICCPSTWLTTNGPLGPRWKEWRELQPHLTTPELLQLAMNCSMLTTAAAAGVAARSLPADLEPQLLRKLLSTAAKHKHARGRS